MKPPRYAAPRLGGLLCLAAGFLFVVLGVVARPTAVVRVLLGVVLIALGILWSKPPRGEH